MLKLWSLHEPLCVVLFDLEPWQYMSCHKLIVSEGKLVVYNAENVIFWPEIPFTDSNKFLHTHPVVISVLVVRMIIPIFILRSSALRMDNISMCQDLQNLKSQCIIIQLRDTSRPSRQGEE